jgi:mono/diheme cytochrome c family protein
MNKLLVAALFASGALIASGAALAGDAKAGEAKAEPCLECHEPAEDFADTSAAEIEASLKKIVAGGMKHKKKLTLSDADIADIAAYLASAQ